MVCYFNGTFRVYTLSCKRFRWLRKSKTIHTHIPTVMQPLVCRFTSKYVEYAATSCCIVSHCFLVRKNVAFWRFPLSPNEMNEIRGRANKNWYILPRLVSISTTVFASDKNNENAWALLTDDKLKWTRTFALSHFDRLN